MFSPKYLFALYTTILDSTIILSGFLAKMAVTKDQCSSLFSLPINSETSSHFSMTMTKVIQWEAIVVAETLLTSLTFVLLYLHWCFFQVLLPYILLREAFQSAGKSGRYVILSLSSWGIFEWSQMYFYCHDLTRQICKVCKGMWNSNNIRACKKSL